MSSFYFDPSLIWHVVFHPGRILWSGNYRHVSLLGYSNDTWVYLDLQRRGVSISLLYHHDEIEEFLGTLALSYPIVKFGPAEGKTSHFFKPMSCVSFSKHLLGVRSSALLPDALFRNLTVNRGCEVINDTFLQRD